MQSLMLCRAGELCRARICIWAAARPYGGACEALALVPSATYCNYIGVTAGAIWVLVSTAELSVCCILFIRKDDKSAKHVKEGKVAHPGPEHLRHPSQGCRV